MPAEKKQLTSIENDTRQRVQVAGWITAAQRKKLKLVSASRGESISAMMASWIEEMYKREFDEK